MRRIAAVTTSRADWGICRPVLRAVRAHPDLDLDLIVGGSHLSEAHGMTIHDIEADGFEIGVRVEMDLSSDTPAAIAKIMGSAVADFADVFARGRPDMLLVLGDRHEMHAAALAALPFKIPVAHIHGGEVSEGAIDDALRHSMTKLSHLHFVATQEYRRRVIQLGEEPWRVTVCGAPSLDNLRGVELLGRAEIAERLGLTLAERFLLVTFHPVTLEFEETGAHVRELLAALDECGEALLFTRANADTCGRLVNQGIEEFARSRPAAQVVDSLGTQGYFSVMALAAAMVGNSSSGIIEAASFRLPVVNIGTRQRGRTRAANVIDVACERGAILGGIHQALSPEFRRELEGLVNPHGAGDAAEKIVCRLREVELGGRLVVKRFHDLPATAQESAHR